jgi:hypothetical protein
VVLIFQLPSFRRKVTTCCTFVDVGEEASPYNPLFRQDKIAWANSYETLIPGIILGHLMDPHPLCCSMWQHTIKTLNNSF